MLFLGNYKALKDKIIFIIAISGIVSVTFLVVLILTFYLLEDKNFSSVPLLSLFILTGAIIVLLINLLRLPVINKVINGEYKLDKDFLKKYSMMLDFKENEEIMKDKKSETTSDVSFGYEKLD